MRAVFGWSWRLLSESERQVLRRLTVFRGGFTREAVDEEPLREVELEGLAWLGMLDKDAGDYQASRAHLTEALKSGWVRPSPPSA